MTDLDLRPLLPALMVTLTGLVVLLAQAFSSKERPTPSAGLSVTGLAASLLATVVLWQGNGRGASTGGSYVADDFALFLHVLILALGIVAVLLAPQYLRATRSDRGEYYTLMLFAIVGMLGLVSSRELISLFVALEIMSVSLYALAGFHREREESQESALKYFLTGAFSSAFFLYGVALLYGVSGSTSLDRIGLAVSQASPAHLTMALLGAGLLLVGFGFKVAAVPFHQWAPDVYEGAPTTATGFMSAAVKAAAFGAFLRVLFEALPQLAVHWQPALAALAILSMVIGNLAALAQSNLKRMLAYSSVAHAGYVLTAMVASPEAGTEAVLFYLVAYGAVNIGAFGILSSLARDDREPLSLNDVAGLGTRRPALAAALAVFLVSLTGVPVSAGFVGKFYLFRAAVNAGWLVLALVGVLMSVVSAYYYLRVVVQMYMRQPVGEDVWGPVRPWAGMGLALSAAVVLGLGLYPGPVLELARLAARSLM